MPNGGLFPIEESSRGFTPEDFTEAHRAIAIRRRIARRLLEAGHYLA